MEWVETTGRTVEEALDAALDELGVDEQDVEYEVLARPRGGIFGRFGSEARIRARVKPISREKPGERRRRPRRGSGGGGGGETREPVASGAGRESGAGAGTRPSGRRRPRRRSGSGSSGGNTREDGKRGTSVSEDSEQVDVPIAVQAEQAEEFTQGLVDAFGAKAEVTSTISDDVVLIEVTGDNIGMLVGPRGATLSAIEELIRTVVQRQTGGHGARLRVDVAGYRAKRREALSEFTRDLAQRVLESGKEQALEPMPAPDRKVVHDVVAEIDGVSTISEGEEPRRRVVIRRG